MKRLVCGNCGAFIRSGMTEEEAEAFICRCGPDWMAVEKDFKRGRRRQRRFPGFPRRKRKGLTHE